MQWWQQPAFYIALVSLMAAAGNYLKSKTAHTIALKATAELARFKSRLIKVETVTLPEDGK
jgi:hypothetical protein